MYDLARIERQLSKFPEAGKLLAESIAIERKLFGADIAEVTRRLIEVSLAGQGRWQQGAEVLEQVVPLAHQLTANERALLVHTVKRHAAQLKKGERCAQAARLEAAAVQRNK